MCMKNQGKSFRIDINKAKRLLALLLLAFIVLQAGAATRRALIIGLGEYADSRWGKIHGDVDLFYVRKMLTQCGFTDIRELKNRKATKQGIERALMDLANSCNKGDVVYIHYSGHGQLMTDLDGDEALRSTARHAEWDEAWIPYDACMMYGSDDKGEKHLSDDEVAFFLSSIRAKIGKKGKLVVAIDACHSGDATRGEDEECVRGVDLKFNIPRTGEESGATAAPKEEWMTISACRPYQLSMEMKDTNIGKLTFALYTLGERVFTMSNKELEDTLNQYMQLNKGRLPQNPMVTGER